MTLFYPFNLKLGLANFLSLFNPATLGGLVQRLNSVPSGSIITDSSRTGDRRLVQPGACYDFDGVDDFVDCTSSTSIKPGTGSMSWSWWQNSDNDSVSEDYLGDRALGTFGTESGYYFGKGGSSTAGKMEVALEATNSQYKQYSLDGFFTSAEGWFHVVVTWDNATDTLKIYKNAMDRTDDFTKLSDTDLSGDTITNTNSFVIGGRPGTTTRCAAGKFTDVRIYNDALTADEIKNVYTYGELGTDPTVTNLAVQYKCDEATGTVAFDSSGNSNHGVITNATLSTFHAIDGGVRYSYQNEVGYSNYWNFNGTTSEIISTETAPNVNNVTITGWFSFDESGTTYYLVTTNDNFTPPYRLRFNGSFVGLDVDGVSGTVSNGSLRNDTILLPNILYHIAATYDGSNVRFYIDGVADGVSAAAFGNLDTPTGTLDLGNYQGAGFFDGSARDVRIYDSALSASDIADLYAGTSITPTPVFQSLIENTNDIAGSLTMTATDVSEIYIPRDESTTTDDVLGNTLQYSGQAPHDAGLINSNCGTFDGVDDLIVLPATATLAGATKASMAAWVFFNDFLETGIYTETTSNGGSSRRFGMYAPSGVLNFGIRDVDNDPTGTIADVNGTTTLSTGRWYHVAGVYDSVEDTLKIYLDGVLDGSASVSMAALGTSTAAQLAIGSVGTSFELDGSVCGFHLYDDALTADEVSYLYSAGASGTDPTTTNLVAQYPFSEGEGTVIHDVSGNGNHGTATNITTSTFWNTTQGEFHYNITKGFSNADAYDISTGVFNSIALSVASQEATPVSMLFNDDGTKLYVMGIDGDDINQYDLSTAYDISTGVFNSIALSVAAQEINPRSMLFNDDGTKLYVLGIDGDDINQYDLSTAYDISTGVFNSIALSVSAQETIPVSMLFNDDGTKLYVLGSTGNDINQYDLSTAYDISTGVFNSIALSVAAQETEPRSMLLNNDGTKLYVMGLIGDDINQYDLSTAYDISTGVFNSIALSVAAQEATPQSMLFNNDGTKLYVMGIDGDDINQYDLGSIVPALLDGTADAEGNTITNPAVATHNNAESISEDTCLPIWSRAKIDVPSFGEFWDSLRTETQVVNRNDLDIEIKDISKSSYKALAYKGGIGYWKPIKSISRHKFNGDIIELNQKHGIVHATPNHSVYDVDFNLVSAESNPELLGCRMISYKSRKEADKDWNIFCSAFVSDGWTTRRNTHGGTKEGQYVTSVVKGNKEWIELLASILENKGYTPSITSAKQKGLTSNGEEYKTLYTVSVVDEELYHQMREDCGLDSHSKKIPSWVFTEPQELQKLFIEHLLNGDGSTYEHKNYNSYRFTTVSKKLATGLGLLLTMVGEDFTQTFNTERKSYDLNWGGIRSQGRLTKNMVKVPYDGYVYDIEVEDFHNFVCGVGNVVVHNTQINFVTDGQAFAPWVSQVYRGYADFDGVDDYLQIINSEADYLGSYSTMTIAMSVNFDNASNRSLINSETFAIWTNGSLTRTAFNGGSTGNQSFAWATGQWYRVVFVYNGTTTSMYVDGVLQSTSGSTGLSFSTTDTYIGIYNDGSSFPFDGSMRNVQIWKNTEFTATNVNEDLATGSASTGLTESNRLVWLELNQGNALDRTSNNNHGTIVGTTFPTYTVPVLYSFGDAFSPSGQTNHYKKEISSVRESDFTMFSPGLTTTGDTTMTNQGYTN